MFEICFLIDLNNIDVHFARNGGYGRGIDRDEKNYCLDKSAAQAKLLGL